MFRRQISTAIVMVTVAATLLTSLAWVTPARAAQTSVVGGNAIKVSPVRFDVKLDPGAVQQISLLVQNLSPVESTFRAHINDFMASSDESGRPNIILSDTEFAPTHSLKRMIAPLGNFTVAAGATKEVKVTITVPKNAPGGGYYAAVRFAPANVDTSENLSLSASVGSLVLLTVNGDIKEEMSVASFDVRKKGHLGTFFMDNKNLEATVRLKNSGNVQVEPFGKITLKRFGKVISQEEINKAEGQVRGNVLPDSIRKFTVKLNKVQSFGKYTLEGNFGYGNSGQLLTAQTTFYVIPLVIILLGVALLACILFLIFVLPRMIKAYNRRVIRRASRRRRY
jgi:hypothetical protein